MRRLVTYAVAWLLAAVAATTAAWQGVALVTHEVTDDRPAALAASDVQDRLDEATTTTASPTTSTTAPPSGPTSTPTSTTTSTTGPTEPAPVTRTYQLDGGVATIQFSPTEVRATGVTPNPGFSVKKSEPDDGGWRVELESDSHRSRLDAWWDGGPQASTREDRR